MDELNLLFECQRTLGCRHASADFQATVHDLLMARQPMPSVLGMVGFCTYEKSEKRAPKASYRAERFIWLGKLNNLKIVGIGEVHPLIEAERRAIIDLPFVKSKLTFKQVRTALGLAPHERFNLLSYRPSRKGKDKDPEDATFFEAKAFHALRKAYEAAGLNAEWQRDAIDHDRLDTLAHALTCFKDDAQARDWLSTQGIEPNIVEAVLEESFDKFIHLSQKALKAILPFMEAGQRTDEALLSASYNQPAGTGERKKRLPPPDKEIIRNPVVYRALNQARKLVNAIVDVYGPPAAVHIEFARDLSKPIDERRRIEQGQKEFQAEKKDARDKFIGNFGHEPSGLDLQKWRLYSEQHAQCPYCQQEIAINNLFDAGYAQIDHALPYSRSFDDSMNNKVLVHGKCNQDKMNKTPYEHFDGENDSERWRHFVGWVQGNKTIRQAKKNKLLRKNFGEKEAEKFRDRHLNDTRYICREFKHVVENNLEWHPQAEGSERCVVLSGELTSLLRTRWGIIKNREAGDLHHAQDAAVIAAASRALIKRMSDYSRRNELEMVRENLPDPETGEIIDVAALRQLEAHFPKPWPHFHEELRAHLSPTPAPLLAGMPGYDAEQIAEVRPVRVSRAPTRLGLGAAHQETIRSIRPNNMSAVKTPLTSLKYSDIDKIVQDGRDAAWIEELERRLKPFASEDKKSNSCAGAKAFGLGQPPLVKPSKDPAKAPIIRSVRLLETQKSGLPVRCGIANNGAMLRVDIFTKGGKFHGVPIYVADAVKKELPNRAVVQGKPEEEWTVMDGSHRFLFTLYPNDWVCIRYKNAPAREGYYAGLDRSTGAVSLWIHDRNQSIGNKGLLTGNGIKTALAVEKYHVDLLGKLHRVHHEERQPIRLGNNKK